MKPKTVNYKAIVVAIILIYIAALLAIISAGAAAYGNPQATLLGELGNSFSRIQEFGMKAFIPYNPECGTFIGILTMFTLMLGAYYIVQQKGKERDVTGNEQGSAGWNTKLAEYNKKYSYPYGSAEKKYEENIILSNDVFLGLDGRKTQRNLNTIVVGGSGAGKSRFFAKPNILMADERENYGTSYVITDPSGELLESCGTFLEQKGYKIRVLNLTDMAHSSCYNPFDYINEEEDVLKLINGLIKNTTPEGKHGGDPFWEKSETALLSAIFFYLWKHRPEEERNFTSVMKLLRAANIDENDSSTESPLDQIFNQIGQDNPNDMAYKSYQTFRMGAGKTLKSILISAAVRLNSFEISSVANLVTHDYKKPERNLDLRKVGMEKTALFCIIPSADDTYNFIVAMMYYQLFANLYYTYDHDKQQLKYPVRFLLDEFANIGHIPDFDVKLATMRKYKISCAIILQNLEQLEEMYDKKAKPLIGNCDTFLFLGSGELETKKHISEMLGTTTVAVKSFSRSRGTTGSSSESVSYQKRELMTPTEVGEMPTKDCIVFLRGEKPFYGKKYVYENHPNYKFTGDADSSLKYNLEEEFEKSLGLLDDDSSEKEDQSNTMAQARPMALVNVAEESFEKKEVSNNKEKKKPVLLFNKDTISKVKGFFIKEKAKNVYSVLEEAEDESSEESNFTEEYLEDLETPEEIEIIKDESEDAIQAYVNTENSLEESRNDENEPGDIKPIYAEMVIDDEESLEEEASNRQKFIKSKEITANNGDQNAKNEEVIEEKEDSVVNDTPKASFNPFAAAMNYAKEEPKHVDSLVSKEVMNEIKASFDDEDESTVWDFATTDD